MAPKLAPRSKQQQQGKRKAKAKANESNTLLSQAAETLAIA
jgi:hypothetical protein